MLPGRKRASPGLLVEKSCPGPTPAGLGGGGAGIRPAEVSVGLSEAGPRAAPQAGQKLAGWMISAEQAGQRIMKPPGAA
jgi:hypothetical protein